MLCRSAVVVTATGEVGRSDAVVSSCCAAGRSAGLCTSTPPASDGAAASLRCQREEFGNRHVTAS
jgi:hypothetical protein